MECGWCQEHVCPKSYELSQKHVATEEIQSGIHLGQTLHIADRVNPRSPFPRSPCPKNFVTMSHINRPTKQNIPIPAPSCRGHQWKPQPTTKGPPDRTPLEGPGSPSMTPTDDPQALKVALSTPRARQIQHFAPQVSGFAQRGMLLTISSAPPEHFCLEGPKKRMFLWSPRRNTTA